MHIRTAQSRLSFRFRALILIGSMAFFAVAVFANQEEAEAAADQWTVYPGIMLSGTLTESGWHFNEAGSAWYGARDFNHASDELSPSAWIYAQALRNLTYTTQYYRQASTDGCKNTVWAQALVSGSWQSYLGTNLHFFHVKLAPTGGTDQFTLNGQVIDPEVGLVAPYGTPCAWGAAHLHQSADLSGSSYNWRAVLSTDTCWIDSDVGQCPADDYDDHQTCSTYNAGNYTKSGTSAEYSCATWAYRTYGHMQRVFTVRW